MKLHDKLEYLQENYFEEWLTMRRIVDQEISDIHHMFCVCGALCTGLHESHCKRFKNKVNSCTVARLSYLLPKKIKA